LLAVGFRLVTARHVAAAAIFGKKRFDSGMQRGLRQGMACYRSEEKQQRDDEEQLKCQERKARLENQTQDQ